MELLVILLSILKVIGFILLAVLALIMIILLLILFSPICYQLAGNNTEEIEANFDIKWILGAIHIYGDYHNKDMQFSLRLFGYCIYGADKKRKKDEKEDIYTEQNTIISVRSKEEEQTEQKQSNEQNILQQNIEIEPKEVPTKQKTIVEETNKKETKQKHKHNRKKVSKLSNKKKKSRNKQKKEEKTENQKQKLDKNYFLHMENKKELFQAISRLCKRMLKGILPKYCYIKATIGTGDPAITGYILAVAGAIRVRFAKELHITGDFTQKIVKDVVVNIKGKILLAYLLYAMIRLLLVKSVRNIIIVAWKGYR